MNKKISILFLSMCLSVMPVYAYSSPYISTYQKEAIQNEVSTSFMGRTYTFGYGNKIKNEYFVAGENINRYSTMIGIHIFRNYTDALLVAQNMYDRLLADNQVATLAIHRFTKEPILTFYLKNEQGLELNIWRFYKSEKYNSVVGMQYLQSFKIPNGFNEQFNLKALAQKTLEQFMIMPKMPFIY